MTVSAARSLTQTELLVELNPVVERELNRHIPVAKEWFPHEYIPWSDGRNYDGILGGEPWTEGDSKLADVARSALIINLLTEDNLPSYHHEIAVLFGRDQAWGDWVHRWTAEEGRHGLALRDYLSVTSAVDPVRARTPPDGAHVQGLQVCQRPERPPFAGLRVLPGARDARVAPQHRQGYRANRSPTSCSPGSPPTRTCT